MYQTHPQQPREQANLTSQYSNVPYLMYTNGKSKSEIIFNIVFVHDRFRGSEKVT